MNKEITIDSIRNFLQPEVRCDTYIGIEMKKIWYIELKMLELLMDICKRYNLKYLMVGGSLLGAMRHKGFIPWDDDIDVGMPRCDYDRFVKIAKEELVEPFFLQTPLTDPGRNIDYVQIRNSETSAIDIRYIDCHYTYNQGIFIDIFPIDGVGDDNTLRCQEKKQRIIRRIYTSAFNKNTDGIAKVKHYVCKVIYCLIGSKRYDIIRNNIFRKVSFDKCGEVGLVSFLFNNNRRNYWKREWIEECITVPFEYLQVSVPRYYDEVLTKTYGEWRNFVRGDAMHGKIDFDPNTSYKVILRDKYKYSEFKSCEKTKLISNSSYFSSGGILVPLSPADGIEIYKMLQNIGKRENDFTNDVKGMSYDLFTEWCRIQFEYANGWNLPNGYVPQSIYWLYIDGKPVGVGKIRWALTNASREAGGNIGYAIAESYRGQGYGTVLFNELIKIAKIGHCSDNKDNAASKRVMEKCNGKLIKENEKRWYFSFV